MRKKVYCIDMLRRVHTCNAARKEPTCISTHGGISYQNDIPYFRCMLIHGTTDNTHSSANSNNDNAALLCLKFPETINMVHNRKMFLQASWLISKKNITARIGRDRGHKRKRRHGHRLPTAY